MTREQRDQTNSIKKQLKGLYLHSGSSSWYVWYHNVILKDILSAIADRGRAFDANLLANTIHS